MKSLSEPTRIDDSRALRRLSGILLLGVVLLLAPTFASAHAASDAYVSLTFTNQSLVGRIDLALRDVDALFGLDDDGDGRVTWAELKKHQEELFQYLGTNAVFRGDGVLMPLGSPELSVDEHVGGMFAVTRFVLPMARPVRTLDVDYHCVFEVDALHRAILKLERDGKVTTGIFSPDQTHQHFEFSVPVGASAGLEGFIRDGVWHIWTGYDHVLFLLALLLPAVARREDGRWVPVAALRPALWKVLQTVTAFTLAHSITLTLASLNLLHLSPRFVEPAIAASVAVAAANNIRPFFLDRGWMVAFGFGLIHGFGFASVLQEIDLSGRSLLWPLLGFNFGVELGQAAVVLLFVPLAYGLRQTSLYRIGALRFGSIGIVLIATVWFVERIIVGH